jgi:hypothetical protein
MKLEQSQSKQKTTGVTFPSFTLLIVVNIWYNFVCLHLQTAVSLVSVHFQTSVLTRAYLYSHDLDILFIITIGLTPLEYEI